MNLLSPQQSKTPILLAYLCIALVYTVVFGISYALTTFPSYETIPLMDGNQYLKMYAYFSDSRSTDYVVNFPFNGRVAYMWLASCFSAYMAPMQVFAMLNYVFGLATLCLLFRIWEKLEIPLNYCLLLIGYIVLHWSGMIRQYMVDPVSADIPYLFFLCMLLYCTVFDTYRYLFVVAIIGVATKEAMIPFIMCLLAIKMLSTFVSVEGKKIRLHLRWNQNLTYILLALVSALLIKMLIGRYFPSVQHNWKLNSVIVVLYFIKLCILEPWHIADWLTAIVLVFGVFLYPFVNSIVSVREITKQTEMLLFTLAGLILAVIGGGDHTRIAFLTFPFFFTAIALHWKASNVKICWPVYLMVGIYLSKCWLTVPTATVNWSVYALWYPEYSSYKLFVPELLVCGVAAGVLWYKDRSRRLNG